MLVGLRVLRFLLFPILRYLAPIFNKKLAERLDFELQNWTQVPMLKQADYGFEVSSEGELEQVKTILLEVLKQGKTVELIFCSPSVESQCLALQQEYPLQLRLYRYPIFSFNPFSPVENPMRWLTCKTLIMCRYDFFPELICYGKKRAEEFILVAASLKNYHQKNALTQKYLTQCYQSFDKIVAITEKDRSIFIKEMNISDAKILLHDFRVNQIVTRLESSEQTILKKMNCAKKLLSFLDDNSRAKIILGSYWSEEMMFNQNILEQFRNQNPLFFVAPHNLTQLNLAAIKNEFTQQGFHVQSITANTSEAELEELIQTAQVPTVWILDVKGILCELYAYFDVAYVGGGFGVSIHSVLEPFIAGAKVVCGPKIHRSTEYSFVKENFPHRICSVENKPAVGAKIFELIKTQDDNVLEFMHNYISQTQSVLNWLRIKEDTDAS